MNSKAGKVRIEDFGEFAFDSSLVRTLRPNIFQPGFFSVFDVLVHLPEEGDIYERKLAPLLRTFLNDIMCLGIYSSFKRG